MAAKENLKALKTLVISMGFLLVGGTILLGGIVWKKVAAESSESAHAAECTGGNVDLRGHGMVIETTVDGQTMRITTEEKDGKTDTYLVDMCHGNVITHLSLQTDATMQVQ